MQPTPRLHHAGETERQVAKPPEISSLKVAGEVGLALEVERHNGQDLRLEINGVGTTNNLRGLPVGIRHILGILAQHPGKDQTGDEIDDGVKAQCAHQIDEILILWVFQDVGNNSVPNHVEDTQEPLDGRHPPCRRSGHLDGPLDQVEPGNCQLIRTKIVAKVENLVRRVDAVVEHDALLVPAVHDDQTECNGKEGTAEMGQEQNDKTARRGVPLELVVLRDEPPHGGDGNLAEDGKREEERKGSEGIHQGLGPIRLAIIARTVRIIHLPIVKDGRSGDHGLGGIADTSAVVRGKLHVEDAFHHCGA